MLILLPYLRSMNHQKFITYLFRGIVFWGSKQISIGYEELFVKCPSCEAHNWADVVVISKYHDFYWIPIFPYDKEANIICKKCGLKRYGSSFNANLISNFEEVKDRFRHPWFTYIGLVIFVFFIVAMILFEFVR
ncbi:MAG: hypothetical protein ACXWCR_08200 [Flavitalea sp.]